MQEGDKTHLKGKNTFCRRPVKVLLKNFRQKQIEHLDTDQDDDDPFEFAAFPVQVEFAKDGEIVFDDFKGIFDFFETSGQLEGTGKAPVDAVEVFLFPGRVGAVENVKIFHHFVFAVQGAADEAQHIDAADPDIPFGFHLVGKAPDFAEQRLRALRVVVHGYRLGEVEHGYFNDIIGEFWRAKAAEMEGKLFAFLFHNLEIILYFLRKRVDTELLEQH